jgi:putative transcriptional regulator
MKNHLKSLRESRGWTQGALADQLGVSRQTVNALETGRYDPALPLAFRIARLFAQPIEAIFIAPLDDADLDHKTDIDDTDRDATDLDG